MSYPNKTGYRSSFLAECIVTGTTYPDMLEESLITILEEEGPNVILQHDSLRFLKTESFQAIYRMSQEECARLHEGVPYVKVYRYNPKHLCPKLNRYRDNGQRKVWSSCGSTHCTCQLTILSISILSVVSYDGHSAKASHRTAT